MAQTTEQQYSKGFNHGYELAKHKPDLLKLLEKSINKETSYGEGIAHGKAQHRLEKVKNRLKITVEKNQPKINQQSKVKGRQK